MSGLIAPHGGLSEPVCRMVAAEEVDGFRDNPEKYLFNRFGGGWFKLNFYEGPTFIVCVNFKPKGEPKWKHLVTEKSNGPPPS